MNSGKPSRRWLRFSLRSLILLLLVAAVGFAVFHDRLRHANRRAQAVDRLREFGGFVRYDHFSSSAASGEEPSPVSVWLIEQFGVDFLHDVDRVCIGGRKEFTDQDFELTCRLDKIESLRLGKTLVTNEGLRPISQLRRLRQFSISSPHLNDEGLDHIVALRQLEYLTLYEVNITDAGLAKLAVLENLERLALHKTQVTESGVASLRSILPNCDISH